MPITCTNAFIAVPTGSSNSFSEEAAQFFERLATPPSDARAALYATMIDALVAGGVWTKLDGLYCFAAANEPTSLVSLVSSTYDAQKFVDTGGTPTFTADEGWSGGTQNGVDTTYNPSTDGGNFARNSANVCYWSLTTANANSLSIGDDPGTTYMYPHWSDNNCYFRINDSAEQTQAITGDSSGLFMLDRPDSGTGILLRNDSVIGTKSTSSAAPTSQNLRFKGTYQTAFASFGSSLTSGQRTALYNAVSSYLTGVGAI